MRSPHGNKRLEHRYTTLTLWPALVKAMAAASPAMPAPTMVILKLVVAVILL